MWIVVGVDFILIHSRREICAQRKNGLIFLLLYVIITFCGFKVVSSSHKFKPYDGELSRTVLKGNGVATPLTYLVFVSYEQRTNTKLAE